MFTKDLVPFVSNIRDNIYGFDKIFDDMVHRPSYYLNTETFPKDNVIHYGDNVIVIELALAGYSREDIMVERDDNFIVVSAEKVEKDLEEEGTYTRRNIATRSFTRSYPVSSEFKDITASYKDGILSIRLEKEPREEVKKLIEIS